MPSQSSLRAASPSIPMQIWGREKGPLPAVAADGPIERNHRMNIDPRVTFGRLNEEHVEEES